MVNTRKEMSGNYYEKDRVSCKKKMTREKSDSAERGHFAAVMKEEFHWPSVYKQALKTPEAVLLVLNYDRKPFQRNL